MSRRGMSPGSAPLWCPSLLPWVSECFSHFVLQHFYIFIVFNCIFNIHLGPFLPPLLDRFGSRLMTILSSLGLSVSFVLTSLAPNVPFLFFSMGFLTGRVDKLPFCPAIIWWKQTISPKNLSLFLNMVFYHRIVCLYHVHGRTSHCSELFPQEEGASIEFVFVGHRSGYVSHSQSNLYNSFE